MSGISRLCIKGLPKHLTEDRLRQHFEQMGEVTDVRICKTGDGRSRCFGFVGFRADKDAIKAKRHFHDSYIDTSKIIVEIAKPVGDDSITRPWSKYSEGSSASDRVARKNQPKGQENPIVKSMRPVKKTAEQELLEKVKSDPNIKAFVEAMKPRAKGKVWENEGDGLADIKDVQQNAVRSKKAGGEGIMLTRTHVKFEGSDESSDEEYNDAPAEDEGAQDAPQAEGLAFSKDVDDLAYLKSKTTSTWKDSDEEDGGEEDLEEEEDESEAEEQAAKKPKKGKTVRIKGKDADESGNDDDDESAVESTEAERVEEVEADPAHGAEGGAMDIDEDDDDETGRLFIRNLAFGVTEEDLRRTFGKFGELSEVHLCFNKETKRPNGLAFVLYLMPQHAAEARAKLDGKFMQGRLLHIIPAKMPKTRDENAEDDGKGGYKKKRDQKLKEQAGSSHNWNMLFMRADTVADAAAAAHDMKKSDLLDADAESMAVRMALAETHVIESTKQKLAEQGVNVAAFTVEVKPKDRSRTVILVKNLPYSAQASDVEELFVRFGDVSRVVLPDTKTMAIVEMGQEGEAKKAFKSLAYSRFKAQPLYLEWGPVDTFLDDALPPAKETEQTGKGKAPVDVRGSTKEDGEEGGGADVATVYIKNLSFETSEHKLKKACSKALGGDKTIKSVRVVKKADKKGKQELSAGYAFVEFASPKAAAVAVGKLKGLVLDGKALAPELSKGSGDSEGGQKRKGKEMPSKAEAKAAQEEDKNSSKIIVRNVPFEATKKELRSLLGTFGQLATLRLPKKFDGKHRGFAFADFLTHQEAAAAKKALEGTHFYGRHLVIEWAEEDNSLEAVRLKTARYFSKLESGQDGTSKRRKLQDALDGKDDDSDGDFESKFS